MFKRLRAKQTTLFEGVRITNMGEFSAKLFLERVPALKPPSRPPQPEASKPQITPNPDSEN